MATTRQAATNQARPSAIGDPWRDLLGPFLTRTEVHPTIAEVIAILNDVVVTPYTIASWLTSLKDLLEAETPIRWLELGRDPARVIAAAELTAARLAR